MPLLDIGEALKSMSDIPFTQPAPGVGNISSQQAGNHEERS